MPARQPQAADYAIAVGGERQRPACRDFRIELAHGARGRIARIDEQLLARLGLAAVHLLESGARHEDLATHLEHFGRFSFQLERDAVDRAYVGGDILADFAIAAGRGPRESAVLVAQADREAVELELGGIFDGWLVGPELELAADARIELGGAGVLGVRLGADGEHGDVVAHRGEILGRRAADAPRRRVGRGELWMRLLQRLQLAEQAVVLRVGELRRVLDVVQAVVTLDLGPQGRDPLARAGHEKTRSASGLPGSMPQAARRARTASRCAPIDASARSSSSRPVSSTRRPPRACASWLPARAMAS